MARPTAATALPTRRDLAAAPPAALEIAKLAAALLLAKKAQRPVLVDVRGLTPFTDYFLICHATSSVHLGTLVNALLEGLEGMEYPGTKRSGVEGTLESGWVLLDCGDLILHIFSEREREYYDLERLWGDAPRTELTDASPRARKRKRAAEGEKPGER